VILDDGRAVAFAGPSGRGKSTLASAFYRAGYQLIADDCLLLEAQADGVQAIPAYPSVRLWQDSLEALLDADDPDAERLVEMAHYTSKKQLLLSPDSSTPEGSRPPLAALFLLGEAPPGGVNETIRIAPVKGLSLLMALIEDSFALDVVDHQEVSRSFRGLGRLAAALQVYRLDYPRNYESLSRVIDKVSNFVVI
jgi:energy-coupling factor transporter ATP-binding protein EcfA2